MVQPRLGAVTTLASYMGMVQLLRRDLTVGSSRGLSMKLNGWLTWTTPHSGALNISTWQTPNTFLTQGLSVGQAMAIIVISRFLVSFFSCVIAWCGLTWHIGFTVQNRFTWGLRGAYIPLIQRSLLNFVWSAVQSWNGGKLIA
jgi:NCS1 family nucleobase:cation symporter-1